MIKILSNIIKILGTTTLIGIIMLVAVVIINEFTAKPILNHTDCNDFDDFDDPIFDDDLL